MKASFKTRSVLALSVVALVACAEKKQLTEMHDSTERMDKTTKEMQGDTNDMRAQTKALKASTDKVADITKRMGDITENMGRITENMGQRTAEMHEQTKRLGKQTGELYDASRQGAALALRRDLLESMYKAESGGKKLADGAKYFMAFEFQFWTGYGPDESEEKRLELMASATSEFFKDVKEYEVDSLFASAETIDPLAKHNTWFSLDSAGNKRATFNALAATMHSLNRKQAEALHETGKKTTSIYEMIADALRDGKKISEGQLATTEIPAYEKDVLTNQVVAVKLLQARHNFIGAILLSQLKDSAGLMVKIMNAKFNAGMAWDIKIDSFNQVQLEQFQTYLKGALATRALLRELGLKPEVDPALMAFYKGMTMKSEGKGSGALLAARTGLIELIEQFRAPDPAGERPVHENKPAKAPRGPAPDARNPVQPKKPDVKPTAPAPAVEEKKQEAAAATDAPAESIEKKAEKQPNLLQRTWTKIKNWWGSSKSAPVAQEDQEPVPTIPTGN